MEKRIEKEVLTKTDLQRLYGYQVKEWLTRPDFPQKLPNSKVWLKKAVEKWTESVSFGLLINLKEEEKQENFEERFDKKLEQFLQKIA